MLWRGWGWRMSFLLGKVCESGGLDGRGKAGVE